MSYGEFPIRPLSGVIPATGRGPGVVPHLALTGAWCQRLAPGAGRVFAARPLADALARPFLCPREREGAAPGPRVGLQLFVDDFSLQAGSPGRKGQNCEALIRVPEQVKTGVRLYAAS